MIIRENIRPATGYLKWVFVLTGLNALAAQVLFLREFLILFNGNELTIGVILAVWLFWTGLGSILFGRIRWFEDQNLLSVFVLMQGLSVVFVPLTLTGIRYSRYWLKILPGESPGLWTLFFTVGGLLSLFCLLSGGLFSVGSRALQKAAGENLSLAAGRFYLYETVGSALGGLALTLVLLPLLNAMQIAIGLALMNGAVLFSVYWLPLKQRYRASAVLAVIVLLVFTAAPLERASLSAMWPNFRIVERTDSPYANLTLLRYNNELTLYSNGTAVTHFADPQQAEEQVHFALLLHKNPRRVLLIGGGVGGALQEILKHPSVRKIDYVETDPDIIRLAKAASPEFYHLLQTNPKIRARVIDGRLFLKRTEQRYDVIVLAVGDPLTAALNRFYTREFFQLVKTRLSKDGIFSFRTAGADNYISRAQGRYLRCINKTLRSVFKQTACMPGSRIHFFAAKGEQPLPVDAKLFLQRLKQRKVQTTYIRDYYLPFRLMPDRVAELEKQIAPEIKTRVNSDFYPVAFYYYLVYWSGQHGQLIPALLDNLSAVPLWQMLLLLFGLPAIVLFFVTKKRPAVYNLLAMLTMGFSMLALELILLLAFQSVYGFVYRQVALLIGFFMAGMAAGTYLALKKTARFEQRKKRWLLAWLQIGVSIFAPVLYLIVLWADQIPGSFWIGFSAFFLFPAAGFVSGVLGGAQFPLISALYGLQRPGQNIGLLYAMDLLGALLAALLLGAVFIPLYGLAGSLLLVLLLNGLLAAFTFRFRSG